MPEVLYTLEMGDDGHPLLRNGGGEVVVRDGSHLVERGVQTLAQFAECEIRHYEEWKAHA